VTTPHEAECPCDICRLRRSGLTLEEAKANLRRRVKDSLVRDGYVVHYVYAGHPAGASVHTHGLPQDFELVLPLPPEVAAGVLAELARRVLLGERFTDGQEVPGVILRHLVRLVAARESGRKVLRVILPDRLGELEPEHMLEPFRRQYDAA
jgi:hypothetical protein